MSILYRYVLSALTMVICAGSWSGSALAVEPVSTKQNATAQGSRNSVIELWYFAAGTTPDKPDVAVLSDGSVWTINGIQTRLTPSQLAQLINDLLETDGMAQINTQSLSAEIQAESARYSLSCKIHGADDCLIRIRHDGLTYEIRCHAAGVLVNRFPQVMCLQRFVSAQRRLENVRAITEVGGEEAAQKLAQVARTQLEFEHGVDLPVTAGDLSMVRELPDGSRYCQFLVNQSYSAAESRIVSVFQSPGTAPRVSLQENGSVVQ